MKKLTLTLAFLVSAGSCLAFTPDLSEIESAWIAQKYPTGSIQTPDQARKALADCEKIRAYSQNLSDYSRNRCNETFFVNRCIDQVRQARQRSERHLLEIEVPAKKVLRAEQIREEKARQASRDARKAQGPKDPFVGSTKPKSGQPDQSFSARAKKRADQTQERQGALTEKARAERDNELATQKRLEAHAKRIAEREKAQQEAISSGVVSGNAETSGSSGQTLPTCTIEIRCDTILDNMGDLTPGKEGYVPSNGTILATSTVSFEEGDTVFDVLTAVCKAAGIQLEYTFSSLYGSNYIEGINNLYEFDCGEESGWMYKVNGWFPNYGCSKYELHDGDVIVWCYTCKGLGADVGGGM